MRLAAVVLCALAVSACATHRPDLSDPAQPTPDLTEVQRTDVGSATSRLLEHQGQEFLNLPPEALAPLTSAAAWSARATGGVGAREFAVRSADQLLGARARAGGVTGFADSDSGTKPAPRITVEAGLALLDAYALTKDERYRKAAQEAAEAVTSRALGWRRTAAGPGVVTSGRAVDIAATARAALLLRRAERDEWRAALATVTGAQAAVGRWYSTAGGTQPMSLEQWATTLDALVNIDDTEATGIAGGGVDGLWKAMFDRSGRPLADDDPVGHALALRLFAHYSGTEYAQLAFTQLLKSLRTDGTVALSDDAAAQSEFAAALAARQLQLAQ